MYQKYIKRTFDIIGSIGLLVITLPVTLFIVITYLLFDRKGPIIFTQQRTARGGGNFKMYKFRTMAPTNNVLDNTTENEITKLGGLLRRLSLDEIPQLLNVLKGDMSFIGPRPWIPEYYQHMTKRQRRRVSVRPGITGLAQASGRNSITIHDKLAFDLQYVDKITWVMDTRVVLMTMRTFLKRSSAELHKLGIHDEIELLRLQPLELDPVEVLIDEPTDSRSVQA
jgi:lipopolysaccharide/colanic/teichoic acid biosynthesis glycosyltransferase